MKFTIKHFIVFFIFLSLTACIPVTYASSPENHAYRVAVLDLEIDEGIPQNYANVLTDRLRQELLATGSFTVMERNKMTEILEEIGFQMSGCTTDECVIEAGQILGVNHMVTGSAGKLGQIFTVSVRLIDVQSSQIVKMVSVDRKCSIEELLTVVMKQAAQKIAGLEVMEPNLDLSLKTGNLRLSSKPSGANVILDEILTDFITPCEIENLISGTHTLRLIKENLVSDQQIEILPDVDNKIKFELYRGFGSLIIKSEPDGGSVLLDGVEVGQTPLTLDSIPAGNLPYTIVHKGYNEYKDEIYLNPYERKEIEAVLLGLSAVNITSLPSGLKVYRNGKYEGLTPLKIIDIPQGENAFLLKHKGYFPYRIATQVEPEKIENIHCQLTPKKKLTGVFYSAIIPGSGQIYADNLKGYGILALQAAAAGAAYYYLDQHSSKIDEYNTARSNYMSAVYQDDIASARQKMDDVFAESEDLKTLRDYALIGAAAVYLYNLIDIAFFTYFPEPFTDYSIGMGINHEQNAVEISFKYTF